METSIVFLVEEAHGGTCGGGPEIPCNSVTRDSQYIFGNEIILNQEQIKYYILLAMPNTKLLKNV